MRLRITGEPQRENVRQLLHTLPTVTVRRAKRARFSCDRGYTNEEFIADDNLEPYDAISINNSAARNPFISSSAVEDWTEACRKKKHFQLRDSDDRPIKDGNGMIKLDSVKMKECTDIWDGWVVESGEMLGTDVSVAHKDIPRQSGTRTKKLTAVVVRDVFDKKNKCKELPFLATGESVRSRVTEFVADPKKSYIVTSNHLFSDKRASADRLAVEQKLKSNGCTPLTVGQREIAWFVLKGFLLTGTNAGKVHARSSKLETLVSEELMYDTDEEDEDESGSDEEEDEGDDNDDEVQIDDDLKRHVLDKCLTSWFARHKAKTKAMAEGTKNEEPTAQNFASMDFVDSFYEVGLLKWDEAENVGVSPDGIALVKIPGDEHASLPKQLVSVEIKTRVNDNTIAKAEEARVAVKDNSVNGDGKFVVCEYDDDIFKKCVPSGNRKQVIHQGLVTGLPWGIFITAKVEEGQGSIVQIVFVHFTDEQKNKYSRILLRFAKHLSLWIFNKEAIERGYLDVTDRPEWVSDEQWKIIESRFKMWSALWSKAHIKPFMPVGALKLCLNYDYNKGKWGLDKCTENYLKICFNSVSLTLESKYVLRLVDGVMANVWKCEQGRTLMKSYVQKYKEDHDGDIPTAKQIRSKAKELSLEDCTYKLSLQWLQKLEAERVALAYAHDRELQRQRLSQNVESESNLIRRQDTELLGAIEQRERKSEWPIRYNKVKSFYEDEKLNKLRRYKSNVITHTDLQYDKTVTHKNGKKTCAMCSVGKSGRMVRQYCSTCKVALCKRVHKDGSGMTLTSCWDAWHTCDDLVAESKQRSQAVIDSRSAKKAARGGTSGDTGGGADGNETAKLEEASAAGGADDDEDTNDTARKNLGASMEAAVAAGGVVDTAAADGGDAEGGDIDLERDLV